MYLEKLKLDGQVAVVTGAGQGIGAACARAWARPAQKSLLPTSCRTALMRLWQSCAN